MTSVLQQAQKIANIPVENLAFDTIEIYNAMRVECPLNFQTLASNSEKLFTFNLRSRMIYSIYLYCWRLRHVIPFTDDTTLESLQILHYHLHKEAEKVSFGNIRDTLRWALDWGRPTLTEEMIPRTIFDNLFKQ
jgi:hypothetical protein